MEPDTVGIGVVVEFGVGLDAYSAIHRTVVGERCNATASCCVDDGTVGSFETVGAIVVFVEREHMLSGIEDGAEGYVVVAELDAVVDEDVIAGVPSNGIVTVAVCASCLICSGTIDGGAGVTE